MDVLSKAVREAKMDHVDLRPRTHGLGRGGGRLSEKQVKRYLEGEIPPATKIDPWARLVADAVGQKDPYGYWAKALKRAKDADSGEPGGEKIQQPHD